MAYNALLLYFQEALVGEGPSEEQLFSLESNSMREGIGGELDRYLQKLKVVINFNSPFHTISYRTTIIPVSLSLLIYKLASCVRRCF